MDKQLRCGACGSSHILETSDLRFYCGTCNSRHIQDNKEDIIQYMTIQYMTGLIEILQQAARELERAQNRIKTAGVESSSRLIGRLDIMIRMIKTEVDEMRSALLKFRHENNVPPNLKQNR